MRCPNCGQEMNSDAVFCISCGQRLSGEMPHPSQKKDKTPLIIGIGILAIVLIIAIACILLLKPVDFGNIRKDYETEEYTYSEEPVDAVPLETPAVDETDPEETTPEETRAVADSEKDYVGLPVPSVDQAVRDNAAQLYRQALADNKDAVAYGLLDLIGTDIPELVVQEKQPDETHSYCIYWVNGEKVEQIPADRIAAGGNERVLGKDGTLIVLYDSGYASWVTIDKQMNTKVMLIVAPDEVDYTASSAMLPANDHSLLDLYLLGETKDFSYTGWICHNGFDYYYKAGKPLTRAWVEEDGMMYYLGSSASVVRAAGQSMLADRMKAYFESYQKAFNEKDASYLQFSTESDKADLNKKLQAEENKFLTIFDMNCEMTAHILDDRTGNLSVDVHLEYTQRGEWADAKEKEVQSDCRVSLVWENNQWYVDHVGSR